MAGTDLRAPLTPADSAVRFTASLETYPDLMFTTPRPDLPWILVEVQRRKDEQKGRSWHLATSVLLQGDGRMGDLVVITASRSVARWAARVAQHRGGLGTKKGLTPVILHLSRREIEALLDPAAPELALFAVWARCRGGGIEARRVAERALEVTEALPERLQAAQTRAILAMLSERLLGFLKEMSMDVNQIPETKASRAFRLFFENRGREEGKAEGLHLALAAVLTARGLAPSKAEREQLDSLSDTALLDRCILAAATATSVGEALAPLREQEPERTMARDVRPSRPRATSGKVSLQRSPSERPVRTTKKTNGHKV